MVFTAVTITLRRLHVVSPSVTVYVHTTVREDGQMVGCVFVPVFDLKRYKSRLKLQMKICLNVRKGHEHLLYFFLLDLQVG